MNWEIQLLAFADSIQADLVGATTLTMPLTWDYYADWLNKNYHADMNYLVEHAQAKKNPSLYQPLMISSLVFGFNYIPHPKEKKIFPSARIAKYAEGEDYHFWMKERLQTVISSLKSQYPDAYFFPHTDSGPVLERDLAYRAGLGWFGKNTCLINRKKGSLFLIGEIFTSLKIENQTKLSPDFCGTCQRCLEVCPTKALEAPHILNAKKCISYWTIESRQIPPIEIRDNMGDWLFGCDLCQTVCPWNQKAFQHKLEFSPTLIPTAESRQILVEDLKWILTSSHRQIIKKIQGTPLLRAGAKGLKRNAIIVIAHQNLFELKADIHALITDSYLGELATWALEKLKP